MSDHLLKNIEDFYVDMFDRALSDVHSPVCITLNISADNNEKYATEKQIEDISAYSGNAFKCNEYKTRCNNA